VDTEWINREDTERVHREYRESTKRILGWGGYRPKSAKENA